jgi:hypothetical protein
VRAQQAQLVQLTALHRLLNSTFCHLCTMHVTITACRWKLQGEAGSLLEEHLT